MSSLQSLKKSIEELKAKQKNSKDMLAFFILDDYIDNKLSYDEAMTLLEEKDWMFKDMVRVLLRSAKSWKKSEYGEAYYKNKQEVQ